MEACKLEDGMVFKVLPSLFKIGSTLYTYPVDKLFLETGMATGGYNRKMIYDDTGLLIKIILKAKSDSLEVGTKLLKSYIKNYIICVCHDDKIKYAFIGKSLLDALQGYNFNINSNDYFQINKKMVDGNGYSFPDYKSSQIVKRENNVDLFTLLKNQKVYIEDIVSKNNIVSNINILKQEGLYGYFSEVISDERDKKISEILAE